MQKDRTMDILHDIAEPGEYHYAILNCPKEQRDKRIKELGAIRAILYEDGRHEAVRVILEIDKKLYQLPCPLSEFTDDGWEISAGVTENTSHTVLEAFGGVSSWNQQKKRLSGSWSSWQMMKITMQFTSTSFQNGLFRIQVLLYFNFCLHNSMDCDRINLHFPEFSIRVRSGSSASESRDSISQSMGGSAYAEKHRE